MKASVKINGAGLCASMQQAGQCHPGHPIGACVALQAAGGCNKKGGVPSQVKITAKVKRHIGGNRVLFWCFAAGVVVVAGLVIWTMIFG